MPLHKLSELPMSRWLSQGEASPHIDLSDRMLNMQNLMFFRHGCSGGTEQFCRSATAMGREFSAPTVAERYGWITARWRCAE